MAKRKRSEEAPAPLRPPAAIERPPRYWEWLEHAFDKPENQNPWYLDPAYGDDVFEATPEEYVALFTAVMVRSGEDLKLFSDTQVKHGLAYHLDGCGSTIIGALHDKSVPEQLRDDAVLSLMTLYSDCFAPRCAPVMCGTPVNTGNYWEYPLNGFCYMLWDVSPLLSASPRLVLPVLKHALSLKNVACKESALHGLGHMVYRVPEAGDVVRGFIDAQNPSGHLRAYAEAAATGMIQ